ncbi:hypothetical protein BH11ARM2_BH11ARM2_39580 [soil metagenome]
MEGRDRPSRYSGAVDPVRPRPFRLDPVSAARAIVYVRRSVLLRFDLFVGGVAALLVFAYLASSQPAGSAFGVAALAGLAAVFIGRGLRPLRVAARMRRPDHEPLLAERTTEIDARGVRWEGGGVSSDVDWPRIQRIVRTPTYLGFEVAGQVFLIPVDAFAKGDLERTGAFARAAGVKVEELKR